MDLTDKKRIERLIKITENAQEGPESKIPAVNITKISAVNITKISAVNIKGSSVLIFSQCGFNLQTPVHTLPVVLYQTVPLQPLTY